MSEDHAPQPWYTGLDADHLTQIQSRGWDKLDGPAAAAAMAKSYRELSQLNGAVAAGNALLLPKPDDAEAHKAFWEKLGTSLPAADYKFDALTYSDGRTIEPALQDALKAAATEAKVPAGMVEAFGKAMIAHQENAKNAEQASQARIAQESRAALEAEWGPQTANNKFVAGRAMDALALDPTAVAALESLPGMGYAGVMKLMHQLGTMMGEARFVQGGGQPNVLNAGTAQERLNALKADQNWVNAGGGGTEEAAQFKDLIAVIAKG